MSRSVGVFLLARRSSPTNTRVDSLGAVPLPAYIRATEQCNQRVPPVFEDSFDANPNLLTNGVVIIRNLNSASLLFLEPRFGKDCLSISQVLWR
ncbi:hypothetical protein R1flu_003664 [Riccia fluitans]|uniref:Uncharacterized protein n=1 Tax=Riccia fluitans TaxID=41844 RepID=A0ABD1Y9L8_9MARC